MSKRWFSSNGTNLPHSNAYSNRFNHFSWTPKPSNRHPKKNYVPRESVEQEQADLTAYFRDLIDKTPGRNKFYAIMPEDWYDTEMVGHGQYILADKNEHGNAFGRPVKRNDVVHDWGAALDFESHLNDWNTQRRGSSNRKADFNSWMREIEKLIKGDTERLSKLDLAQYQEKLPPMSTMAQRARKLESDRGKKPNRPYEKVLNNLLNRPMEHSKFNDNQNKSMIDFLKNEGVRTNDNIARQFLEDEFKDRYVGTDKNRLGIFGELTDDALEPGTQENKSRLDKLNRQLPIIQDTEDLKLRNTYLPLRENKEQLEKGLIQELVNYGNQEHLYGQTAEKRNKKVYDVEAYLPYSKLNKLKQIYGNIGIEPGNPNAERQATDTLKKALLDYGIGSVNGPGDEVDKYEKNRNNTPSKALFGANNLTEFSTPEILESQYTLQRMDPKFKGENYQKKKDLQRDLYGKSKSFNEDSKNKTLANVIYNNAMATSTQDMARFDSAYKKAVEEGMNKIAHKYIRLGQPGSLQQIKASEAMIKQLTSDFDAKRTELFGSRLQEEQKLELARSANKRAKLTSLGQEENSSANKILSDTRAINNEGVKKLSNLQTAKDLGFNDELERLKFNDSKPPFGGKGINDINQNHLAQFDKLSSHYSNRNPFEGLDDIPSLKINDIDKDIRFNEYNLAAPDDHTKNTTGTLKEHSQYNDMKKADAEASYKTYKYKQHQEDARKKQIEDNIINQRNASLVQAAEDNKELSEADLIHVENLLASDLNEPRYGLFDQAAKLLEKKTKRRLSMYPMGISSNNPYHERSMYHPNARQEIRQYIADIKAKNARLTNRAGT